MAADPFLVTLAEYRWRSRMEVEHAPDTVVALYTTLADAEATLHDLEGSGVPYPKIRMAAHAPGELEHMAIVERTALADIAAPGHFWSLAVLMEPLWAGKAMEVLRKRQPFAVGAVPPPNRGRGDTDGGALAWRHYVFESDAATDIGGEHAGTTGGTGIITSGAFANSARAEGNPPAAGTPASDERPSDKRQQPTSDTMRPDTSTDRSRPGTELKQ
jgi:hypothetical protein